MLQLNKIVTNYDTALAGLNSGMTVMAGGFGLCGIPENCLRIIAQSDLKYFTFISNNAGVEDFGLGLLLKNKTN